MPNCVIEINATWIYHEQKHQDIKFAHADHMHYIPKTTLIYISTILLLCEYVFKEKGIILYPQKAGLHYFEIFYIYTHKHIPSIKHIWWLPLQTDIMLKNTYI